MAISTPNHDEALVSSQTVNPGAPLDQHQSAPFIGNFHKTLPHNAFGEVDPKAYRVFERICTQIESGVSTNFESVPAGPLAPTPPVPPPARPEDNILQTPFQLGKNPTAEIIALTKSVAKFVSPLAGAATESLGPDPKSLEMLPAPGVQSITASAEIVELYWMALLRDVPLVAFQKDATKPKKPCAGLDEHDKELGFKVEDRIQKAVSAVNGMFATALEFDASPGRIRTTLDLAPAGNGDPITEQTLFRSGLSGEQHGPLISQFFLRNIGYGTQTIDTRQIPYLAKRDFLTTHGDWLLAQNTGKDQYGRDYGTCNNFADQNHRGAQYYPQDLKPRYISTMRDLARFVNRDALHQAYFNAALFLLSIGAPLNAGNPYRGARFTRETAFASLGGPDLLTLVSEVASRALKVVWRQKWLVHRRCRPEVMAGLIQMQRLGHQGHKRQYGLPEKLVGSPDFKKYLDQTLDAVAAHNKAINGTEASYFLPMAFSAGSPSHPAYGAGHATVAGACVTALKAWFAEDERVSTVFANANAAANAGRVGPTDPPGGELVILQPGYRTKGNDLEAFCDPVAYAGGDANDMTIGGELNKVASNVAMGRSMGGVHWRTDNTRSLRLGEEIAIEILRKRSAEYAEKPLSFSFRSFNGGMVLIANGQVERSNND